MPRCSPSAQAPVLPGTCPALAPACLHAAQPLCCICLQAAHSALLHHPSAPLISTLVEALSGSVRSSTPTPPAATHTHPLMHPSPPCTLHSAHAAPPAPYLITSTPAQLSIPAITCTPACPAAAVPGAHPRDADDRHGVHHAAHAQRAQRAHGGAAQAGAALAARAQGEEQVLAEEGQRAQGRRGAVWFRCVLACVMGQERCLWQRKASGL